MIERLDTPHGHCVLVAITDPAELAAALAALPAAEQALAHTLGEVRRRDLILGRTALHLALEEFTTPILRDDRGAPVLPAGWVGSVSHKGDRGLAIVTQEGAGPGWVGVDLELAAPPRQDIARRILTPRELAALPDHGSPDRGSAVMLRFAIKEAIYKAVDPVVRRYVGFTEVELEIGDGVATVRSELPLVIQAAWRAHGALWVASARAVKV